MTPWIALLVTIMLLNCIWIASSLKKSTGSVRMIEFLSNISQLQIVDCRAEAAADH